MLHFSYRQIQVLVSVNSEQYNEKKTTKKFGLWAVGSFLIFLYAFDAAFSFENLYQEKKLVGLNIKIAFGYCSEFIQLINSVQNFLFCLLLLYCCKNLKKKDVL